MTGGLPGVRPGMSELAFKEFGMLHFPFGAHQAPLRALSSARFTVRDIPNPGPTGILEWHALDSRQQAEGRTKAKFQNQEIQLGSRMPVMSQSSLAS